MIDEREIPTLYQKLKSHIARDFRPSTATQTIVTGGGGATAFSQLAGTIGNAQAPQFLLRDGSRSLTGSMAVADGATIDGVDISVHAVDPDAHHARQHSIVSSSDHTITGAALSLVGATATNTLGLITPSANPGTTESVLKAMGGLLTLPNFAATTAMRTPLIDTASGNLTLQPAGSFVKLAASKGIESNGTFVSGFTGAGLRIDDGITKANKTSIEADNLTIRGTMRVYELVIQQIRMTNGSLLVSSAGKVKAVSGTGPYTLTTDGQHGFAVNDLILAQRWNPTQGALTGLYIYRSALWVTSITTVGTDWHFTAVVLEGDAPIEGAEYGRIGNTTDTSRQGGIYLTSDDTYAPYIDIYNDVDSMADWTGAAKLKARLGRLTGISDAILNPAGYGLYSSNAYLKGALSAANGNVLINDDGVRVRAFADPAGVLADINAYRFERQDGTLVGGLYGGGSSTGHITELVTEAPATGYAFTILKSVGNTSSSTGMADVILQAGNDASPTKEASVWVDVDDTAALVRLIADDFIRFEAPTQSFDTHAPYLDLGADLGSVSKRWGVLHVNQIIAYGSISGASIGGAVWQYPGSMVIDANSGSDTVVNVVNNGAGAVIFDVLGQIRQNGTNVSLVGHLHDDRYVQLGSLGSYLLASGATTGATSQAQTFTNGVRTGNGTALVPAFSFSASDSTGIYRQAADSLSIATVGTERLRVNASGQISFNGAPITGYVVTAQPATGQTGGMTLEGTYASAGFLFNTSAILRHAAGTTIQAMRWVPTEEPQGAITTFVNINNNLRLDNSAFNVTNVRLAQGQLLSQAGYTGAITSLSMFHALNASLGGATLTNQYGYYCAALSGATNNYAFYSAGSTPSYFGGTVQIVGDAEVTGNLLAANGTVGAPSVAALGDTNTGLYWSAADTLAITTGGTQRATFSSTGLALPTGRINATAIDQGHILDTALVGTVPGASNWAGFAHKNRANLTDFALIATDGGDTLLNGKTVAAHYINGAEVWRSTNFGLQSPSYASQTTGWRISSPSGAADFRYLYTDEMHAKAFIADLEQALAGGQIIAKSVTLLASDFRTPYFGGQQRITVRDLPSAPGMQVFVSGDHIALRSFARASGELLIGYAWGTVTSPADNADGTQTWTFNRSGTSTYNTITQRGTATSATTAAGTSVAPSRPTGVVSGDVLVAIVTHDGAATTITATGWTLLEATAGTDINGAIYYKVAGGSEPTTYTFLLGASRALAASVVAYFNVDTTYTPIDDYSIQANAAGANLNAATVWCSSTAGRAVFLGGVSNNSSATIGGAFTELIDTGTTGIRVYVAHAASTVAGETGSVTATIASSSHASIGALIMLRPTISVFYDAQGGGIVPGSIIAKDAIIVDYGTSGNGYYEVNAADGLNAENSPYSQIVTWTTHPGPAGNRKVRSRWGNLNGLSIADYGLVMGTDANSPTTTTFDFRASTGNLTLGANGGAIVLEGGGNSYFSGAMTIGTSGGIYQGTGTFAAPTTGLKIWNSSGIGRIGGYNTGTLQWYANTDGKLYAGAGNAVLDSSGISVVGDGVFRIMENASTLKGFIYSSNPLDSLLVSSTGIGMKTNGSATSESVSLRANASGGRSSEIAIEATGSSGTNRVRMIAYSGSAGTSGQLTLGESSFTLALNGTSTTDFSVDGSGNTYTATSLQVAATNGVTIGVNAGSGGYTALTASLSATSGGYAQLQAVSSAGSSFGLLALNPGGGNVSVNTNSASYALDVNGAAHASSFPTSSDARFKENLTPLVNTLDRILRLGTYNFTWRKNYAGYDQFLYGDGTPVMQIGFVAQEVEAEFPELISRWRHTGKDGIITDDAYSVDYARMVPILVQAIRELRAEVTELRGGR